MESTTKPSLAELAKITRGTVVYADLRDSVGHEQTKTRYCVVISADFINTSSALLLIVVLVTSDKGQQVKRWETKIVAPEGGLEKDSIAQPHHIKSIDRSRILRIHEQVTSATLQAVVDGLMIVVGAI